MDDLPEIFCSSYLELYIRLAVGIRKIGTKTLQEPLNV